MYLKKINNEIKKIEHLFDRLFPLPRSITGDAYRKSLKILSEYIPFKISKIPSGKNVFHWTVPKEWKIKEAYILDPKNKKIIDFKNNNLHLLSYSKPIDKIIDLKDLKKNLYSLPKKPNLIPYATSYYKRNWGFCLTHKQKRSLVPGKYRVVIKSEFRNGYVEWGESYLKGNVGNDKSRKLILISSYLCHPSMANNELSGPIMLSLLYEKISKWKKRNYDYLYIINPETIGSICFLYKNGKKIKDKIKGGLVLTCVGGPKKKLSYKKSRAGSSNLDRLFTQLAEEGECQIRDFNAANGSDERQYCSSEFNMPVGQISKTTYASYAEYHTSGDNKKFVKLDKFIETSEKIEEYLKINDSLKPLIRRIPYCEVQLGKYDLYPTINYFISNKERSAATLDFRRKRDVFQYITSYADGKHDLLDVAKISKIDIRTIFSCSEVLYKKNILK